MGEEDIVDRVREWRDDIVLFVEEALGVMTMEPYQKKALRVMSKSSRTVVVSCHDVGKTFIVSLFFLWALYCHAYTTVITTAPSFSAVRNLLWREISKRWRESKIELEGNLLDTRLEISGDKWFGIGLSPKKDSDSADGGNSNFQGFHNRNVFIIFDEASGIDKKRWEAAKSMLTSANTWFVAIGNPMSPVGGFKDACDSNFFETIRLSCFDSPNLKANKIKNINDIREEGQKLMGMGEGKAKARMKKYKVVQGELLTLQFVMQEYIDEGEDSPFFQSRILGVFPKEGENALVSAASIQTCMNRENIAHIKGKIVGGADLARFGDDSSVIYVMDGNRVILKKRYDKKDTVYMSETIAGIINEYGITDFGVDDTGMNGVTDQLKAMNTGARIYAYIASGKAKNSKRFLNIRAESVWMLRLDIQDEVIELLPNDKKLLTQLTVMNYEYKELKIKIEPKDKIKKKLGGRSPDDSDGLVICNYVRKGVARRYSGTPVSLEKEEMYD